MNTEIFKAYDIRGKVGDELTNEVAWNVGKALADWLPSDGPVAVGYDMRTDSKALAEALIEGVRLQGRPVINIGLVTTDMIYFAVFHLKIAGGAMVTASHNGPEYNGIKLCREEAKLIGLGSGLDEIRDMVAGGNFVPAATKGLVEERNLTEEWLEHALNFVDPKKWPPYHIAIDAGNGMLGMIAPLLEPKLPNVTVERLYYELDGSFPNHEANPQKVETLADISQLIVEKGLDFGIAFDGDGDRAALIDDTGKPVMGSDMLSLIARYYLQKYPGAEIVHDVRTSRSTRELIREWGGSPVRTKVGRIMIKAVMYERGAPLGGEVTGHFYFKENRNSDSGLIAALTAIQALSETGKKLSEVVADYRRYVMAPEYNFEITDATAVLEHLRRAFADGEQDELDGLTVNYPDKWFNVRTSNTEPLVRLTVEAHDQTTLDELVAKIRSVITGG